MPFAGRVVNSAKICASINLFWRDPRPHSHSSLFPLWLSGGRVAQPAASMALGQALFSFRGKKGTTPFE